MRKSFFKAISVMLISAILSLVSFSNFSAANVTEPAAASENKVLESRFLNMLNHNYVYNDSFNSLEEIVNDSVIALLDMRDREDDSFVADYIVNAYLYDMYGITIDDFSAINPTFPQKEGYVFIIPRGYSLYDHEAISLNKNEDGTYTFITKVTIRTHDGSVAVLQAETLFVKNPASKFGYNIVFSNISDKALNI
ncbi:MAG: hypothetical protein ACOYJS_06050 [Acutalibacteraceae bacterium]|jgi:hypothetical protein